MRAADKGVGKQPGWDSDGRSPAAEAGFRRQERGRDRAVGCARAPAGFRAAGPRTARPPTGRPAGMGSGAPGPRPTSSSRVGAPASQRLSHLHKAAQPSPCRRHLQRPAPPALAPRTTRPGAHARLRRPQAPRPHPPAPASGPPCKRGGARPTRPDQSQASAPAEHPMSDELLRAGGCGRRGSAAHRFPELALHPALSGSSSQACRSAASPPSQRPVS